MKDLHTILKEVTKLTLNIQMNYPELYRSLDENPMALPVTSHPQIDKKVMQEYLVGLKELLERYIAEEKIKNE
ncbi:hypothetical protein [Aureibaculum luteum]|uniref:hypothetical protein n=1 Tax=Aureibaculum luteum TaxID=1548456 RepID=UPI000E552EBD|nr:hypothetical protein [Aureibaculum luteum]